MLEKTLELYSLLVHASMRGGRLYSILSLQDRIFLDSEFELLRARVVALQISLTFVAPVSFLAFSRYGILGNMGLYC